METTVFVGTSLDGFIARSDGSLDWLQSESTQPQEYGFTAFFDSVDAVLIGRKTYDVVLGFEKWFYGSKPVFVLSRTLRKLEPPERAVCELVTGTPKEVYDVLERRGFRHVYVDGGVTVQGFLEAGLIQRVVVSRLPVLIGTGIPLFGPLSRDVRLEHVATRSFPSGLVQSEYRVIP